MPEESSFSGADGSDGVRSFTSSAADLNSSVLARRVDAGVVGVGQVVQDEIDAFRGGFADRLLLLAAGGEAEREQHGEHGGDEAAIGHGAVPLG